MSPRQPQAAALETILLVEDEPVLRRLMRAVLSRAGYTVLDAPTPQDAVRTAADYPEPIHLLLTDVVMPEMNGRDVAEECLARRPDLRVIFVSGYPDAVIRRCGIDVDRVDLIRKPFDARQLPDQVRRALDRDTVAAERDPGPDPPGQTSGDA